jgi:hypothetical protein
MKTQDAMKLNMNHVSLPTVDVMTEEKFLRKALRRARWTRCDESYTF